MLLVTNKVYNNMNRLKGMTAYLCGAMDRVEDGGVKWRQYMTPKLQDLYTKKENDRRELRITAELYELFTKTF